ncbi:MAG: hypothetical protein A2Z96_07190 [Spirochaetes bacterium GWB1_48_6]|nr:MAG: hypothetical protein A2Z96_07190 [Spirochaetes bacterium GWB1_48_6]
MSRAPDDEKFKRILETAYREFNQKGFREATIKAISDQAGVAPGSVYTYFTNKADLFKKTIQYLWEKIFSEIDNTIKSDKPFNDKFFRLYDIVSLYICESPVFLTGMVSGETRRKLLKKNLELLAEKIHTLFKHPDCHILKPGNLGRDWDIHSLRIILTGALFDGVIAGDDQIKEVFSALKMYLVKIQGGSTNSE